MTAWCKLRRPRAGFTLIELLVVIVIIGILATLALSRLNEFRKKAKETQTAANLNTINRALEQFGVDNNSMYPFRIRWFDQATVSAAGFDPYKATTTGTGLTSDAGNGWFSLGLIGGVPTVTDLFADNTYTRTPTTTEIRDGWTGMQGNKILQPNGWDSIYPDFYRRFNQYSDPLHALGYLDSYPTNPFLTRPMGNIMWSYGDAADESDKSAPFYTLPVANADASIPAPGVVVTPGDFVYTFFYQPNGAAIDDPTGVVEAKKSYQSKSPKETDPDGGLYCLDLVDSYQLWGYGDIPRNGAYYVLYRNNSMGLSVRGHQGATKDWNGNGTKDMFEIGLVQYFKQASTTARTTTGKQVEF
jgi:prepilin-type N-terminal cleavage/methylation domain-containing protein